MENKLNIAELLKDCPKGMELYSTIYGTVYFDGVRDTGYAVLIDIKTSCNTEVQFYPDGKFNTYYSDSEMTLFPSKDVRTWEGFQRPFKDGDIVATENGIFIGIVKVKNNMQVGAYCAINEIGTLSINTSYVFERLATEEERQKLFKAIKDNGYKWNAETKILVQEFKDGDIIAEDNGRICIYKNDEKIKNTANYYCGILSSGDFRIKDEKYPTRHFGPIEYYHLATEEKRQRLFEAIKANGFRWNSETKTLEKLVNPNFKVGSKIIRKGRKGIDYPIEVLAIENGRYKLPAMSMPIDSQDEWELVSDKFDITTLKPFDKVLVRNDDSCVWKCNLYSHYSEYPHHYICMDTGYKQCIPYNSNEHLVGTTNDCSDFYKTWEK